MKTVLLLLFVTTASLAQKKTYRLPEIISIDSATNDIVYEGVVEVAGASAADLYSRAKTYYLKTFKNSNAVIQADEKDKRVGGKGLFTIPSSRKPGLFSAPSNFMITLDVQVKDGRYRYEFSQFNIVVGYPSNQEVPAMHAFNRVYSKPISEKNAEVLFVFDEYVKARIDLLNQYMSGKIGTKDF